MKPSEIISIMIAPCGMNCAICMGHLREKNRCAGCRKRNNGMPAGCRHCVIFFCEKLKKSGGKYCFLCESFPCRRLKQLDKRYRAKYGMSEIENLLFIKEHGIKAFVKKEQKRWKCRSCGALMSCHRQQCPECGKISRENAAANKKMAREIL